MASKHYVGPVGMFQGRDLGREVTSVPEALCLNVLGSSKKSWEGGRLERILSSLAREWLRITNRLLIVEDPESALRSPNKLMRVKWGVPGVIGTQVPSCHLAPK